MKHYFVNSWRVEIVFLAALIAVVSAVYAPGLHGSFTFDDYPNIVDNTELHVTSLSLEDWAAAVFSSPSSELQRPLAMVTLAANYYFTGLDPFSMKLTNLIIHLINAVLAYLLTRGLVRALADKRQLLGGERPATLVAASVAMLWALAPINFTPVLYVVQRMESLAQVFVFIGLICYVVGRVRCDRGRNGWPMIGVGVIGCTLIGTLAKETAAVIPLYAFLIEWLIFQFAAENAELRKQLGFFFAIALVVPCLVGAIYIFHRFLTPGAFEHRPFTLAERLLTETRVCWRYVQWTLFPDLGQLSLYHDDFAISHSVLEPPTTLLSIVGWGGTPLAAVALRHRRPMVALGILLFFSAHLLTGTVLPLELVYEHRNYFASYGLFLATADLAVRRPPSWMPSYLGVLLVCLLAVFFIFTSALRAREWGDPIRFVVSEAAKHPTSPRAMYEEGRTFLIVSNYDPESSFLPMARQAFESSLALDPNISPEQALLMMDARAHAEPPDSLWESLTNKLKLRPIAEEEVSALYALTNCQLKGLCDFEQTRMLDMYYAALEHPRANPDVLTIFANYAGNYMHDYELAVRLMRSAVEQAPRNPQYKYNLIKMLTFTRNFHEAHQELEKLRQHAPMASAKAINQLAEQLSATEAANDVQQDRSYKQEGQGAPDAH